ncbi:MAG: nucleotidyltransferase domain-containing protein [Pseudomonadota bacterium]
MKNKFLKNSVQSFFEEQQKKIDSERITKIAKIKSGINKFIKKYPEIETIYLVGSLVKPEFYRSESDADIVVKGLSQNLFLQAGVFLEKLFPFSFDLIPWVDIKNSKILEDGMKIYEKK